MRAIADDAGVDPALVNYFFGSKRELFAAAMALSVNPAEALADVLAAGREDLGRRILERLVSVWDDASSGDPLIALVRAAASEPGTGDLVREFIEQELVGPIGDRLGKDRADARVRAGAAVSQLLGLIFARYVLRLEPLASADPAIITALLAPTLDRLLDSPASSG